MATLLVKKLDERAKLPTVANPGEDLAYDLYALETVALYSLGMPTKVRTGIAVACTTVYAPYRYGLLIRDRSSMAAKGTFTHGGVIDAGYRGEIQVLMTGNVIIQAGDKIAQMIPIPVSTGEIIESNNLPVSDRGEKGFGSSGK